MHSPQSEPFTGTASARRSSVGLPWSAGSVVVLCGALVLLPLVFPGNLFVFIFLANAFVYMILALGLQLIFGYAGMIHLSQASFFGIGAYASALVTRELHWPFLAGLGASVAAAVLAGLIMSPIVKLKAVYFALASFSIGPITLVLMRQLPFTGGVNGLGGIPAAGVFGYTFETPVRFYYLALGMVILVYAGFHLLTRSPFGMSLRALKENDLAARSCGVNVAGAQVKVILVGVGAAGLAGSLVAHVQRFISPDMFSVEKSLFVLGITVVGGLGSLPGAILATGVMMFLAEYTRVFQQYIMFVYGLILALFMIFLPRGLWGLLEDATRRLRLPSERGGKNAGGAPARNGAPAGEWK